MILYDLQGNYLVSNKELNLVAQKKIPHETLMNVLESDKRVDEQE